MQYAMIVAVNSTASLSDFARDPGPREELHFRRIDMRGYRRPDGLYEIEGRIVDRKPHVFDPTGLTDMARVVPANEPIHNMGVRLLFDTSMQVLDVETFTADAPYAHCVGGGDALQSLKGLSMTKGWAKEVSARLGGARSCTHLREILIPMASAAFQSLTMMRLKLPDRVDANGRPLKLDSCYAYGVSRELVRSRWPEYYQPEPADK